VGVLQLPSVWLRRRMIRWITTRGENPVTGYEYATWAVFPHNYPQMWTNLHRVGFFVNQIRQSDREIDLPATLSELEAFATWCRGCVNTHSPVDECGNSGFGVASGARARMCWWGLVESMRRWNCPGCLQVTCSP